MMKTINVEDMLIGPDLVRQAKQAKACHSAIRWLTDRPRTIGELARACPFWVWWAGQHLDLPEQVREWMESRGFGRYWLRNGVLHRDDGPAMVRPFAAGEEGPWDEGWEEAPEHFTVGGVRLRRRVRRDENGRLHSPDSPAVTISGILLEWRKDGKLHRQDGPAVVIRGVTEQWWYHGRLHKENGPAAHSPFLEMEWWKDGQRHRADGPACVREEGHFEWWHHGSNVNPQGGPRARIGAVEMEWWENGQFIREKRKGWKVIK